MKRKRKLFGVFLMIVALLVAQLPASEASAAASASDFSIQGTKLIAYVGSSARVVIPDSITEIGSDAFANLSFVESVVIPKTVTKLHPYAFWNCSGLKSVELGLGLSAIGDYAFANCKNLNAVSVPANVKSVGIHAFEDDVNLCDITFTGETHDIHETAFEGCYRLTIHAPEGSYADTYAQNFYLKQLDMSEYEDIPHLDSDETDGSSSAGDDASLPDSSIVEETIDPALPETGTSGVMDNYSDRVISSVFVVANQAFLFMDNEAPTVVIGSQLNSSSQTPESGIEGNNLNNSTSASDSDMQQKIIDSAQTLRKFAYVDGKIVADQAFYRGNSDARVCVPDGILEIGSFSYARNTMQSLSLPDGLQTISYGAFYHCDQLMQVVLPDSVICVEPKAFSETGWMNAFLNGENGDSDFLISGGVLLAYRGNEREIVIPEGVRVIAAQAFQGKSQVESVSFPSTLTYIGEEAFAQCTNLQVIDFSQNKSLLAILDRAFDETALHSVELPDSVRELGIQVFPTGVLSSTALEGIAQSICESTQRLSNQQYRISKEDALQNTKNGSVKVQGLPGAMATLEGANTDYVLTIADNSIHPQVDAAFSRALALFPNQVLPEIVQVFDCTLMDQSQIPINKLGKQILTIDMPIQNAWGTENLAVYGLDRNGQLEKCMTELVQTEKEDTVVLRVAVNHLSPLCVCKISESQQIISSSESLFAASAPDALLPKQAANREKGFSRAWKFAFSFVLFACGATLFIWRRR